MFPTKARYCVLTLLTAATLICLGLSTTPHQRYAIAHRVEIVNDIGVTLHIEPSDTPRAGEEVLAWFALTRKGGEIIPLSACDCALTVSKRAHQPANAQADAIAPDATFRLTPTLKAVESEGYQGIPGATFTFPEVGVYTLAISGSPQQADSFNAFELTFDVTVAAGQAVPQIPVDEAEALPTPQASGQASTSQAAAEAEASSEPLASSPLILPIVLGGSAVVLVGVLGWMVQHSQPKP